MRARYWILLSVVCIVAVVLNSSVLRADDVLPNEWTHKKVKAGVYADAPFAIPDPEMEWKGYSVDLLAKIASRVNLEVEYVRYETLPELYAAIGRGDVEIGVGNILVTSRGVESLEFTQPIMDGGFRIMVSGERAHSLGRLWRGLVKGGHIQLLGLGAFLAVVASLGVLLFLRLFDPQFTRHWRDGWAESFYHVMSVIMTGKTSYAGNLGKGWLGKVIAALWLCFGVATVAYVTSSVASVMTANTLTGDISGPGDLPGRTVGVIEGSPAVRYMSNHGAVSVLYKNLDDAVVDLVSHKLDAIVSDSSSLEYYDLLHPEMNVIEVGALFERRHFAFAVGTRSAEIRQRLNIGVLLVRESGVLDHIQSQWFAR